MNRKSLTIQLSLILIPALIFSGFSGCINSAVNSTNNQAINNSNPMNQVKNGDSNPIVVAVSVPPQEEFVERVGGNHVKVICLLPPGADCCEYDPTAGKLAEISKADIYLALGTGLNFETVSLPKISEMNKDIQIINTSNNVTLIKGDPHAWVSPKQAMVMVENIYKALAMKDPSHEEYYRRNKDAYLKDIGMLDNNITSVLSNSTTRSFMVYPDNWGYFARDYGLNMLAINEDNKDPSPTDIQNLVDDAKAKNIKTVFVTPEFNPNSAREMASELGATVAEIDPLAPNYMENMNNASQTIAKGMK